MQLKIGYLFQCPPFYDVPEDEESWHKAYKKVKVVTDKCFRDDTVVSFLKHFFCKLRCVISF